MVRYLDSWSSSSAPNRLLFTFVDRKFHQRMYVRFLLGLVQAWYMYEAFHFRGLLSANAERHRTTCNCCFLPSALFKPVSSMLKIATTPFHVLKIARVGERIAFVVVSDIIPAEHEVNAPIHRHLKMFVALVVVSRLSLDQRVVTRSIRMACENGRCAGENGGEADRAIKIFSSGGFRIYAISSLEHGSRNFDKRHDASTRCRHT